MKILVLFIFSMVLIGCPKNMQVGFTSIAKGNLFGNGSEGFHKQNIVISSQESWNTFLVNLDKTNTVSKTFENSIDFSKETIIIVIDKVRNSGGFSIEVTAVVPEGTAMVVKLTLIAPKPMDMVTMAIVQPYHIVKVNKTPKEIKFIEL
jgi:hypothetical protein